MLARSARLFWERLSCHERGRVYDADTGLLVDDRTQAGRALSSWHHVLGPRAYYACLQGSVRRVGGNRGVGGQRSLEKHS